MKEFDEKQLNNAEDITKTDFVKVDTEPVKDEFVVYKPDDDAELSKKEKELSEKFISDSAERVKENSSSKNKLFNSCCFAISLIILLVIILYQANNFGVSDITESIFEGIKYRYIFMLIGCVLFIMLFDSLRTHVLLYKSTKIHRPFLSYKSTAICRYYDCITPFSFGGQPFQVYYLNTRGVRAGIATSVPMAKYFFSQIAFCVISLIMLIIGASYYGDSSGVVITFSIISLAISFLFLFVIIFVSIDKKYTPKVIMSFIKFLSKIKLVKDYKITFTKTMRTLLEYQRSIKYYLKSFFTTFMAMLLSVGMIVLKACIPYLIYLLLIKGQGDVSFFVIFSKFIICELATMFIPLPGGSGMAEISFTALFATLFMGDNSGYLVWAMLLYRLASYYFYLLQGVIIVVYDLILGDKRNEKFKNGKLIEMQLKVRNKMKKG